MKSTLRISLICLCLLVVAMTQQVSAREFVCLLEKTGTLRKVRTDCSKYQGPHDYYPTYFCQYGSNNKPDEFMGNSQWQELAETDARCQKTCWKDEVKRNLYPDCGLAIGENGLQAKLENNLIYFCHNLDQKKWEKFVMTSRWTQLSKKDGRCNQDQVKSSNWLIRGTR